jgi:hypothetical protein
VAVGGDLLVVLISLGVLVCRVLVLLVLAVLAG